MWMYDKPIDMTYTPEIIVRGEPISVKVNGVDFLNGEYLIELPDGTKQKVKTNLVTGEIKGKIIYDESDRKTLPPL